MKKDKVGRGKGILLYVSTEQAEQLTAAAQACGESRAAFIRRICAAAVRGVLK